MLSENVIPSRGRPLRIGGVAIAVLLAVARHAQAIELSQAETERIGRKIWQNECNGTVSGLTSWNAGENFASLGIGHFIWYPKDVRGPFEESFPKLVSFISGRGAKLPVFLLLGHPRYCPWNSRAEFVAAQQSPQMKELRIFLRDTVDLQAEFLVKRLQDSLPKMATQAGADAGKIQRQFDRVGSTSQGCYALVDYVNFKGEGTLPTERYKGQGWGLLQVLERMNGESSGPGAAEEFATSARAVLQQRVRNSPPERHEDRWLPGWLSRVATYAHS
ncbi:MAG: hypothetical protein ACJ8KU_02910 [Chthoniobacterales bacterium]